MGAASEMIRIKIAALACVGSTAAFAQPDYPTKPIRLIVPFAPGGGTDIVARVMAQKVSEIFRQSVVIDNRGGAGGVIGMEMAVRATPDGYTLGIVSGSIATTAAAHKLPYDPVRNFAPRFGLALRVNPRLVMRGGYGIYYDRMSNQLGLASHGLEGSRLWPVAGVSRPAKC